MTAMINLPNNKRRRLAQVGLTARGVLYCLVGLLALRIAFSGGGGEASQSGALQTLAQQPFGTVLVALVGLGLVAYAVWRFAQFFTEKGSEDSDTENAVMRTSYVVRGVIYVALAFTAFSTAFGSGGGGGSSNQGMAASVMKNVPGGVILVGLVGLIIIGVACYQGYKAFSDDFMEELRQGEMDQRVRTWTRRIGVAGHSARAVVYTLIGIFIMRAAVQFDPKEAKGLDGALQELSQQSYGPWLLALVALGLFLFGIYTLVRARYVDVSE
ncbi:DUF1206 domain-containing protein [soil metagenome]